MNQQTAGIKAAITKDLNLRALLTKASTSATKATPPIEYMTARGESTCVKLNRVHPKPVNGTVLKSNSVKT